MLARQVDFVIETGAEAGRYQMYLGVSSWAPMSPVPEPAGGALAGFGMLALAGVLRRRRAR